MTNEPCAGGQPPSSHSWRVVYGRLRLSAQCSMFELSKPDRLIPARSPYKSVGTTDDVRGSCEVKWVVLGVQAFGSGVVGFSLLEGKSHGRTPEASASAAYAPVQRRHPLGHPTAQRRLGDSLSVNGQSLQGKYDLYCCRKMVLAHGLPLHRVVGKRWRRVRLNIQDQLEAWVQNMCEGHSMQTSSRQDPLQNCVRVSEHVRLVASCFWNVTQQNDELRRHESAPLRKQTELGNL